MLRTLLRLISPEGVLGLAFVTMAVTGTAAVTTMATAPVGDAPAQVALQP